MKILFLCSSVEPGKDGVGDYTKLLCSVLIRKGCQVQILALCDKYVEGLVKESKTMEDSSFAVTRISINTLQSQRFALVQDILSGFSPDWVSLQFVPYGFNPRGLPFWLPHFLSQLKGHHQWHIMFHELWVGRSKNVGYKNKMISFLQETIIKQLLKKNQPKMIHTHLPVYMSNLEKLGYKVKSLPLFSNINPTLGFLQSKSGNKFKWAFFSQIETSVAIIDFINTFNIGLKVEGILPELIIIGGNKRVMSTYAEEFKIKCSLLTTISCTGFLNENEISETLKICDMGITPVPQHALGKSGSTATFLAHGIPVAAPILKKEYIDKGIGFFDKNCSGAILTNPDVNEIEDAQKTAQTNKHKFTVEHVSICFINDLRENTNI